MLQHLARRQAGGHFTPRDMYAMVPMVHIN